jgi:hypothetical protein
MKKYVSLPEKCYNIKNKTGLKQFFLMYQIQTVKSYTSKSSVTTGTG